jgi:tetratricopeptide (TPR) repeat protein
MSRRPRGHPWLRTGVVALLAIGLLGGTGGCMDKPSPVLISNVLTVKAVREIKREEYNKALKLLDEALYLNRENHIARLARANVYLVQQEYEKALADYDQVLVRLSMSTAAYYGRGVCYYALRDYRRAKTDFDKVIELDPEYAEAYLGRAKTYERLGIKDLSRRDMQLYKRMRTD